MVTIVSKDVGDVQDKISKIHEIGKRHLENNIEDYFKINIKVEDYEF